MNYLKHVMRLVCVFIAWVASIHDSFAQENEITLKTQLIADGINYVKKSPGCMVLGEYEHELGLIQTDFASTPQDCWQACADSFAYSYFRGVYIKTDQEGEFGFVGSTLGQDYSRCYSINDRLCQKEYDWFIGNGTVRPKSFSEAWVHPCYVARFDDTEDIKASFSVGSYHDTNIVYVSNARLLKIDRINVRKLYSNAYMCTLLEIRPSNEDDACMSWRFQEEDSSCNLYKGQVTGTAILNNNLSNGTVLSGNLYCKDDYKRRSIQLTAAGIFNHRGCMTPLLNALYYDLQWFHSIEDPHACRRLCQALSSCVLFRYNSGVEVGSSNLNCWLKSSTAMKNYVHHENGYLGSRDCHTCLDGYYIQDPESLTDSCYKCKQGFYCPLGNRFPCPGGTYCGTEGLVEPISVDENNQCPEDRSGVGCQHYVCRDSELGVVLVQLPYQTADAFDFAVYNQSFHPLKLYQNITDTGSSVLELWHTLQFLTAALPEIVVGYQIQYSINGESYSSGQQSLSSATCTGMDQNYINTKDGGIAGYLPVGFAFGFCLSYIWQNSYQPANWDFSEYTSNEMPHIEICEHDHIVHFHSMINAVINTVDATTVTEDASITYSIGTNSTEYVTRAKSDESGRIVQEIIDKAALSDTSYVILHSVSKPNLDTSIRLCLPGLDFSDCDQHNALTLPQRVSLSHLFVSNLRLIDVYNLTISGQIIMALNQAFREPSRWCGKVNVQVVARSVRTGLIISEGFSNDDGNFTLSVPRDVNVKLEVVYEDHLFEAAFNNDTVTVALLDSGMQVSSDLEQIIIQDTKTNMFSLTTYATACRIRPENVAVYLTYSACSHNRIMLTPSDIYSEWAVPATLYTLDVDYATFSEMQETFELAYPQNTPTRVIDLRKRAQTTEVIYNPQPEVSISIMNPVADFRVPDGEHELPFDLILEGSRQIDVTVTTTQRYQNSSSEHNLTQACYLVPDVNSTSAVLRSTLATGQAIDQDLIESFDLCTEDLPCNVNFTTIPQYQEIDAYSIIQHSLYVGPPQLPTETELMHLDSARNIEEIQIFVKNEKFWPQGFNTTLRALIVGSTIPKDTNQTILLANAEMLPLFYLYAPPMLGGPQANAAFTSVTLEGSFLLRSVTDTVLPYSLRDQVQATTVQASASFKTIQPEVLPSKTNVSRLKADMAALNDEVVTFFEPINLTLTTGPQNEDMVLLLASTANIISTSTVFYNYTTSSLGISSSIAWTTDISKLVFLSRSECETQVEKLEQLMKLQARHSDLLNKSSPEETPEAVSIRAKRERDDWLSLLHHWDVDKRTARQFPLQLLLDPAQNSSQLNVSTNQVILGPDDDIYIEDTAVISSKARYANYESLLTLAYEGVSLAVPSEEADLSYFVPLSSAESPSAESPETISTLRRSTSVDLINADTNAATEVLVNSRLVLPTGADGSNLCVAIFQSPYSGSHVYEVCGGRTRCPRVAGTDAVEAFDVYFHELPADGLAVSDAGSVSFYVDASAMAPQNSTAFLDLAVSVEVAADGVSDIRYAVEGHAVDGDHAYAVSVAAGARFLLRVSYERLSRDLRYSRAVLRVASACDAALAKELLLDLSWPSLCPSFDWSGPLSASGSTWTVSAPSPSLSLEFAASAVAQDLAEPAASLWAAASDASGAVVGAWQELWKSGTAGVSALPVSLDGELLLELFGPGQVALELRSACEEDGEVVGARVSERRLGLVDVEGPALIAWAASSGLRKPARSFAAATFRFDEPVDCAALELAASVHSADGARELHAEVSCSSRLSEVDVVVALPLNASEAPLWSEADIAIELVGVQDLVGNPWTLAGSDAGAVNATAAAVRRLGKTAKRFYVRLPALVDATALEDAFEWELADDSEVVDMVEAAVARNLPEVGNAARVYYEADAPEEYYSDAKNGTNSSVPNDRPNVPDGDGEEDEAEDSDSSGGGGEEDESGNMSSDEAKERSVGKAGKAVLAMVGLVLLGVVLYRVIRHHRRVSAGSKRVAPIPKRNGFEEGDCVKKGEKDGVGRGELQKVSETRNEASAAASPRENIAIAIDRTKERVKAFRTIPLRIPFGFTKKN